MRSFEFKEGWLQLIATLPQDKELMAFKAVCSYYLDNEVPQMPKDVEAVFSQITKGESYVEPSLRRAFDRWIQYKKSKRQSYKTQDSLRTCYKRLVEYSGGDPVVAEEIIDQAIGNNYAGFFPPKRRNNGNKTDDGFAARIFDKLSCADGAQQVR